MSTSIEQELKYQLDSVRVRVRPDLAREAHRSFRRQRVRRRSIAAATTAIAVGAAVTLVATGTVPSGLALGKPSPATSPSLPAGGVPPAGLEPAPPSDGLSAQQAAGDIFWMHSTLATTAASGAAVMSNTFADGGVGMLGSGMLTAGSTLSMYIPGVSALGSARYRDIEYARDGRPTEDFALSSVPDAGGHESTITAVSYKDRAWARDVSWSPVTSGTGQDACHDAQTWLGLGGLDFTTDPGVAESLLSCPAVTVARGVTVDGIGAIKLTDSKLGETLWINAVTGLPIESVFPYSTNSLLTGPASVLAPSSQATVTGSVTTRYGYLAASPSNLAHLSASLPAGFRGTPEELANPGSGIPTGKYTQPWVPPAAVIPPFGLRPAPAGDSLTPAQAVRDVLWTRTTTQATRAPDTVVDSMFTYGNASRDLTYTPSGQPWDDDSTYVKPGTAGKSVSVHTVVNYGNRTASIQTSPAQAMWKPAQDACGTAQSTGLAAISFTATPGAARALLDCSGLTVTRGLTLDGIGVIKIAGSHGETLWINATTYLPIEVAIVNSKPYPPAAYDNTPSPGQVIQYTWLPPTAGSLAYLGIPIPAGFTRSQSQSQSAEVP
jgi:hypothetical protein